MQAVYCAGQLKSLASSRLPFIALHPSLPSGDGEVEDHLFTIYAESAVYYETQWTTNMLNETNISWTALGGYILGPDHEQTDTNVVPPYKIYRVVAPYAPPP